MFGKIKSTHEEFRHTRLEVEDSIPENSGISQNPIVIKTKLKKVCLLFLFLLTLFAAFLPKFYDLNKEIERQTMCVNKRLFSLSPPYDNDFFFSLYNHWINATCNTVPPHVLEWLKHIWSPSPYKNETMLVRGKYFAEINNTKVILKHPSNKLLIGISSQSSDFQRRQLVRTHQIKPYNNSLYDITWKFVIFAPKPQYLEAIRNENETYGDIIALTAFNDSREASRRYKPFEWFKYVEKNIQTYKYVAKLDTDCFLNIPVFWDKYFNQTVQELDYAIIALFIEQLGKLVWPMGAFEAISWKTMLLLNRLYERVNFTDEAEDLQLGWYLHDAELIYTRVAFPSEVAYDFRIGCNPSWISDVPYNALRVHELKAEKDYINVANCFNASGVDRDKVDYMRSYNWTL